jgi:hypothetical protein
VGIHRRCNADFDGWLSYCSRTLSGGLFVIYPGGSGIMLPYIIRFTRFVSMVRQRRLRSIFFHCLSSMKLIILMVMITAKSISLKRVRVPITTSLSALTCKWRFESESYFDWHGRRMLLR